MASLGQGATADCGPLLSGPEADEGLDPLVDRVGAAVGERGGSVEVVGLGDEDDLGKRIPCGEFVGELGDEGDGVLSVKVADEGDHEIVVGFSFDSVGGGRNPDSLGGISGGVVAGAERVFHEGGVVIVVVIGLGIADESESEFGFGARCSVCGIGRDPVGGEAVVGNGEGG